MNKQYIHDIMTKIYNMGYNTQKKLWNRIIRLRKKVINYS
jgi:hypothetical protein